MQQIERDCFSVAKRRSIYIYDVSISGFTRSSMYIYDISSLRVKAVDHMPCLSTGMYLLCILLQYVHSMNAIHDDQRSHNARGKHMTSQVIPICTTSVVVLHFPPRATCCTAHVAYANDHVPRCRRKLVTLRDFLVV